MNKILILMSTYNGEKFLKDQLNSLLRQIIPENYELNILIRDDGSNDSTIEILDEYKNKGNLEWYNGENLKPAKSFWDLIKKAPESDYYCFCDQDDIWMDNKIMRAINALQNENNMLQPLLYCSNVMVADSDCKPLYPLDNKIEKNTDFANSLLYSLAPGCTMVFNNAARREFIKYNMDRDFEIIHDWLAHKIVAMLGKVIYDAIPTMYYRQHGNNVIGAQNTNKLVIFFKKIKRILGKNANVRSMCAKSLLKVYGQEISEENKDILNMVAFYQSNRNLKKDFLNAKGFSNNLPIYLKACVLINKI